MKFKYIAFAFLWGSMLCAQPLENALLWKITGKDLKAPSYLFGTVHITCDATLSEPVKKALEETAQLYLEIDMADPMLQLKMVSQMMLEDNGSLKKMLSDADYGVIDKLFTDKMGMSLDALQTVKPLFLSMMLLPHLLDCPIQSFEQELLAVSAAQNEPVFGLETVENQLKALASVPVQEQLEELLKSAKNNLDRDAAELQKVMEVYRSQDIEGLLKMSLESENTTTSKYTADLLDKRNRNWIPVIAAAAAQKPTFFGVGAAHLPGDEGVIKLLRKQGYKVEPVK